MLVCDVIIVSTISQCCEQLRPLLW